MVGGKVYYSTGIGGVAALDATTGKLVWNVDPQAATEGPSADDATRRTGGATRAVSYYDDGGDGRILALVGGVYLTAINAKTGKLIDSFGERGRVDLRKGQERGATGFIWRTGPSVIVRGVIVIGSVVNDINASRGPQKKTAPPGDVRGIDVKTGKQLWIWHSIPRAGEPGNETWLDNSWEYTGHANVWGAMSADEELGYVFMPETTPTNDWYGGKRPGDNLFAESIVALDARTGKPMWHFQGVHHGLWDYDFPCAPVLLDITVAGKTIKALAQPSKQAYLYVLDRKTGALKWKYDTARKYTGANGVEGNGGSFDAASIIATHGLLIVNSGYGMFGQAPGNVHRALRLSQQQHAAISLLGQGETHACRHAAGFRPEIPRLRFLPSV